MHTDVMQWDQALSLAEQLAPQKMGFIAREYAQQLEQTYRKPHLTNSPICLNELINWPLLI